MILTIPNKHRSIRVHKHAVRPIQPALQRIAVRAVTFLAIADQQFDVPSFGIDVTNAVRFGVGEVDVANCVQTHTFRTG